MKMIDQEFNNLQLLKQLTNSAVRQLKKKHCILAISYLRTATSFLNAWNCSGVGSVTFKIFTATSPTSKIFCSVTLGP